MDDKIEKKIEELDNRRAQILQALCEEDRIFIPELILGLVHEVRSITKVLRILKGEKGRFET